MGASSALRGAGLGAVAPGACGAGPVAGGGAIGPVDCAERLAAKRSATKGIEIREYLLSLSTIEK
jgi:hypothetical protein